MHGSRDNEVLLQGEYDVIVISQLGSASGDFYGLILKERLWLPDAFHSNFLSGMHGFRDNEVLLPTRYDIIMISPFGGASGDFCDWFWKSDDDFLRAFYSNFLSGMHGFWDNKVLLQGWYDVIMISPLGGVSYRFCWRNLKGRPQFHNHGSLTHFGYLSSFRSYSIFYFGW